MHTRRLAKHGKHEVKIMTLVLVCSLVAGLGFVTAAIIGNLIAITANPPPGFNISMESPVKALATFMYCMFAGPYLVADNSLTFWRSGYITVPVFAICAALSGMWSFCSGILIVQVLALSGVVSV